MVYNEGYMDRLTLKQKKFIQEYVKNNGNGTQAVLRTYNTTDPETARSIASENLTKPDVKQELERILRKDELKLETITDELATVAVSEPVKGYTGADKLEAIKTVLKLHGVLTDRKVTTTVNLNADLTKLSKYELLEMRKKKIQETDAILEGEEV